jgi:crotonobetainyl-CoA:carnitine CoA-transferase CaiB-like acyl-CoA transferase
VSTYYLAINRNKRSIALDLTREGDRNLARRLAERADVFVENFKPGGLARFGLDYESVSAANPRIIYASISGFGSGAGKDLPGYDLVVQAMSGLMSMTGAPDGPAYRSGISVFDVISGLHTAIAILAALNHRAATGQGQLVEASLMASALSGMVNQTSAYAAGGVVPFRMGNAHPSVYPYEPFPTGDGDLVIAVGNDAQFRKLCEALGAPNLGHDPLFATNPARTANREQLRALLIGLLAERPAAEWFGRSAWTRSRPRGRGRRPGEASATRSRSPPPRPATRSRRPPSTNTATRSAPGWKPHYPERPMCYPS